MGSTNILKNINNFSVAYPENYGIDKQDIKNISKELCRAHREGSLSTEVLQQIIEHLLAYYIEHDLEKKFLSKSMILENKINKISQYHHG